MDPKRLDKWADWLSTGAIAIGLGSFVVILGWLFPLLRGQSARNVELLINPQIALVGGSLLILAGLLLVLRVIIEKRRSGP